MFERSIDLELAHLADAMHAAIPAPAVDQEKQLP